MDRHLLGGLSPAEFLRRHWQKRPLLIRGALQAAPRIADRSRLFALAARDDCESRLVIRDRNRWHVEHGPFSQRTLRGLPATGWTLLVQGVERFLPEARELLARFAFVPHARLDDLMVSYAPPGGGVGPHFDTYDVFLLQAGGRRRWRVSAQRDLELVANAPLRILRRFRSEGECTLAPGDMLYLPPRIAHDGVAIDECFTCSVGFRAPSHRELASAFLAYLEDRFMLEGMYTDPDLAPQPHASEICPAMIRQFERVLAAIRWTRADVADFLGRWLSEPKAGVTFRPARRVPANSFRREVRRHGAQLAPGSRMLYAGQALYLNGERFSLRGPARAALIELADRGFLPAAWIARHASVSPLLYRWYLDGYIRLRTDGSRR